jgi:hypothetical protein
MGSGAKQNLIFVEFQSQLLISKLYRKVTECDPWEVSSFGPFPTGNEVSEDGPSPEWIGRPQHPFDHHKLEQRIAGIEQFGELKS